MDEEGFIYFIARGDGMIKSQGYRISPSEVEEILMEGGHVAQAAVIGLPEPDSGERVHAIVVPADSKALDTKKLLEHCSAKLPFYMVPKSIEVVSALPKTPNGKVDYKTLRAERTPARS
jgi:acyl-coenzyme A synthetase/AMP-(fatty) acid ligase